MGVKRTAEINCTEKRGGRDVACKKCGLPLNHHGLRFEILEYDDLYDVYAMHAYSQSQFDPNLSVSTKMMVLHVSGKAFAKFREYV